MRKGPEEFLYNCKALYIHVHYVHAADFKDCKVRYDLWIGYIDRSVLKHVVRVSRDNYVAMHFHPSFNLSSEYGHVRSKTFAKYMVNPFRPVPANTSDVPPLLSEINVSTTLLSTI